VTPRRKATKRGIATLLPQRPPLRGCDLGAHLQEPHRPLAADDAFDHRGDRNGARTRGLALRLLQVTLWSRPYVKEAGF
jgi:hypothetical protein